MTDTYVLELVHDSSDVTGEVAFALVNINSEVKALIKKRMELFSFVSGRDTSICELVFESRIADWYEYDDDIDDVIMNSNGSAHKINIDDYELSDGTQYEVENQVMIITDTGVKWQCTLEGSRIDTAVIPFFEKGKSVEPTLEEPAKKELTPKDKVLSFMNRR